MSSRGLVPCVRCARHVRVGTIECPFCGAHMFLGREPLASEIDLGTVAPHYGGPPLPPSRRPFFVMSVVVVTLGLALLVARGLTEPSPEERSEARAEEPPCRQEAPITPSRCGDIECGAGWQCEWQWGYRCVSTLGQPCNDEVPCSPEEDCVEGLCRSAPAGEASEGEPCSRAQRCADGLACPLRGSAVCTREEALCGALCAEGEHCGWVAHDPRCVDPCGGDGGAPR